MSQFLKAVMLVIRILALRKEIQKHGTDAVVWELTPMNFSLDWFVDKR